MKHSLKIALVSIIILFLTCKQEQNRAFDLPQGIWIAKDYYNSFEKTLSAVESKKAFSSHYPAGLRINYAEQNGNKLNIGYSRLHHHLFRPEVSGLTTNSKGDTIYEQGRFSILTNNGDKNGYYRTSPIWSFKGETNLRFNLKTKELELINNPKNSKKTVKIDYVQIDTSFSESYKFPNPIYYYTRKKLLSGSYTLLDSTDNILSSNFSIEPDGKVNGFDKFKNMTIYYSTDVYCGPPLTDDRVVVIDILNEQNESYAYNITRDTVGNILLAGYNRKIEDWEKLTYKLVKN